MYVHVHICSYSRHTVHLSSHWHSRLIHLVIINGNISALHMSKQLQYIPVSTPRTPYISKLFEKRLEIIQTWAILPAEAQILSADVIS